MLTNLRIFCIKNTFVYHKVRLQFHKFSNLQFPRIFKQLVFKSNVISVISHIYYLYVYFKYPSVQRLYKNIKKISRDPGIPERLKISILEIRDEKSRKFLENSHREIP